MLCGFPAKRTLGWLVATTGAIAIVAMLAGCGGSSAGVASTLDHSYGASNTSAGAPAQGGSASNATTSSSAGSTSSIRAQYLIKALNVGMSAADPRKTAAEMQDWILTTDSQAQSAGLNYTEDGDSFDVSMTFSVQASLYPKIESYLANYAQTHGAKLLSLQETVQDVSNDYIDTQSRLTNLRGEQQRLLTLMNKAQSLNDILTIEQRLSDVEGQIEQMEAHLNALSGQTTFYTVHIRLVPTDASIPSKPQPWNPGGIFHDALNSALTFGQWLLTVLIWLSVYGIYIVPTLAVILITRSLIRRRREARLTTTPAATPSTPGSL